MWLPTLLNISANHTFSTILRRISHFVRWLIDWLSSALPFAAQAWIFSWLNALFYPPALEFIDEPAATLFSAGYLQKCINERFVARMKDFQQRIWMDRYQKIVIIQLFLRSIFCILSSGGCICTFCWKCDLARMYLDRHKSQTHLIVS